MSSTPEPDAWEDLQNAHSAACDRIGMGQNPHEAARQAVWDHCRAVMCWGMNGHEGRPRARRKWATRVWRCPRCTGQFICQRAYAGYGESRWEWVRLEDARA